MNLKYISFYSPAGILSLIALILLSAGTAFGIIVEGGTAATALIFGLAMFIVGFLAIGFGIIAKKAYNDKRLWQPVKWVCTVVMLAIVALSIDPMGNTIGFLKIKSELDSAADEDISEINNLPILFKEAETERLENTVKGLRNFRVSTSSEVSPSLRQFMVERVGMQPENITSTGINEFKKQYEQWIDYLTASEIPNTGIIEVSIDSLRTLSAGLTPLEYNELKIKMQLIADKIGNCLTNVSREYTLPTVHSGSNGTWRADESDFYNYRITVDRFARKYQDIFSERFQIMGLIVSLVLGFFYILWFLLTYSSLKSGPSGPKISDNYALPL